MKRILILLLALLTLALPLVSCDSGTPAETKEPTETNEPSDPVSPTSGEIDRSGDYIYNPRLKAAYRVNDTTIRAQFTAPVAGQQHILVKSVVACADRTFQVRVACTEAYPIDAKANQKYTYLLSDTWEFVFKSTLPASPVLCITEPEKYTSGDAIMEKVFFGAYGEGLYGEDEYGILHAAILECGKEKIEGDHDPRPHVLWAEITNPSRGLGKIKFSEPVCALEGGMQYHLFVCDNANPDPGAGGSWQVSVANVVPENPQRKGGQQYADTYTFAVHADLKETFGVIRISENDKRAGEEFGSDWDNDDVGRVLVGISGKPVRADYYAGWDVCFAQYDYTDLVD